MHIDPTAFGRPVPRILIGPGERHIVYEALNWGMPERRGDENNCPVQVRWGSRRDGEASIDTERFGFSLDELEQTHDALESTVDDVLSGHRPTEECEKALELVEYAMAQLGYQFAEAPVGPQPVEDDVLIAGRWGGDVVWMQCGCGSTVDLYDDGKLQCRDHDPNTVPTCLNKLAAELPWRRRDEVKYRDKVDAETLEKYLSSQE